MNSDINRKLPETVTDQPTGVQPDQQVFSGLGPVDHEFKNFHRLLCERFGYLHDEVDWKRDQISLIEWIAKRREVAERQRDGLLKAITLIAAQSVGDDWTVEEAYAFVKQHAREARNAVRAEMGVGNAT
ncbi:hypothetical protein A8H39_01530 [Paraburkholderia fungorum]|uniref:hypothetical protein n=1 Tax=Paraburkholderia fungorum TaxID=134537 RepID=UPI0004894A65